jgi:U3 small nucleolar RNA-associated protein 19
VRFFQLVDVFLASGLVPAYTAAAFAKRFARLALAAPPAGAVVAVAFVHNLLRRHPACNILLHRWDPLIASSAPPLRAATLSPSHLPDLGPTLTLHIYSRFEALHLP